MMGSDATVLSVLGLSAAIGAVIGGGSVWVTMALRRARQVVSQQAAPPSAEVLTRLGRLELALDSVAVEVERIGEAERFATRLLAATSGAPGLTTAHDAHEVRTVTPH
ncbi:MAG TPA: hypothetical protein VFS08_08375 [Gemmatimonadaceae bacterium]|nr:hypothetical protein [Gemmatimonadaceae bacterium]